MRIGIIGGGAAGLTTAWLLGDQHQVTLFEKQDRLGGHANTIYVEADGQQIGIDAGFEFFSDGIFPTFNRLLNVLDVAARRFPLTVTLYTADRRQPTLLPPVRGKYIHWSGLAPVSVSHMLRLQHVLKDAYRFVALADPSITVEQFVSTLNLPRTFQEQVLYPILLVGWWVELEEFKTFSAYNVFKYFAPQQVRSWSPSGWNEVVGGTQAYIRALSRRLARITIKPGTEIIRGSRKGTGYVIWDAKNCAYEFDQLVVATSSYEACQLLAHVEGADNLCRELSKIDHFRTTIAVHGDRRMMPLQERHWSVVNIRYDSSRSANTVWKPWVSKTLFRSWIADGNVLPEPLYGLVTYYHPKVNANYFQAQGNVARFQGKDNLWLAGVYTHDVDCHESAIVSAVKVAQAIAPESANLKLLA